MKTKHKMAFAKLAYQTVHLLRSGFNKSDIGRFHRNGAVYELDLSQGIDFSLFLLGSFEPGTRKALRKLVKPGFHVLDVGANIGAHTLALARLVGSSGKVVACEPTDFAFNKLTKNLALNTDLAQRVTAIQCFLGSTSTKSIPEHIYSGWPLIGQVDVHPQHLGSSETTQGARSMTLDAVVRTCHLPRVDLIKLDVDGFECDVLAGASETLSRHKPIFVMEVAPYVLRERQRTVEDFLSYFQTHDYRFYHEKTFQPLDGNLAALVTSLKAGESVNVVAIAAAPIKRDH